VKTILIVGDVNVDLIFRGQTFPAPGKEIIVDDFVMTLGGSSAICAVGLARLGNPVVFVGKLGTDSWGDYCVDALRTAGVDVARVIRDPTLRTGISVSITSARDRALVTFPGSIGSLCADEVGDAAFREIGHLHVSSFFLQQRLRPGCRDLFARATAAGLTTSLDPGFDPAERWVGDLLATLGAVDVFFPNEAELAAISGRTDLLEGLRRLRNGRTRTVAKLGQRGCATLEGDALIEVPGFAIGLSRPSMASEGLSRPSIAFAALGLLPGALGLLPGEAVDSTGAGDSFNAAFLHAWLRELPIHECLRWGAAGGSLSARGLGGTARQADVAEVQKLLAAS
jgi:sugar/nucleoside kinase (ribokinase family)